jgi:hypothetical protein
MTIELTSESNYNWKDDKWSIPLTLTASQFFMVAKQPILLGGGFKYCWNPLMLTQKDCHLT